ncbi:MAG: DUF1062 domain-containing protein [Myxococcota bacterium]
MSNVPTLAAWRVRPLHTPAVLRRCPRCDGMRRFRSSDRFRVNAQGRRLDVWLIYRCSACSQTWNRTVEERVGVDRIPPELYAAYLRNDLDVAWDAAFAPLRGGAGIEAADFVVETSAPAPRVRISMPWPLELRLDRVLAQGLGRSRSQVREDLQRGRIRGEGPKLRPSSRLTDGLLLLLDR